MVEIHCYHREPGGLVLKGILYHNVDACQLRHFMLDSIYSCHKPLASSQCKEMWINILLKVKNFKHSHCQGKHEASSLIVKLCVSAPILLNWGTIKAIPRDYKNLISDKSLDK